MARQWQQNSPKGRREMVKISGTVVKAHSSVEFDVEITGGTIVRAYVAGRMKIHHIRIIVGDEVDVEMSPYDLSRGRIVQRHK